MQASDADGGDELYDALLEISEPIRVLHVDDDEHQLKLAAKALEDANDALRVASETSGRAGLDRLAADQFDCIVSDYQMPRMDGLEFLDAVRDEDAGIPFILFTGKGSEQIAAEAIEAGVSGYLQKEGGLDHYAVLANRIETAVSQRRAEARVQQSIQALEASRDGIAVFDEDGVFQYVNRAYAGIYGYEPGALIGEGWEHLYPEQEVLHYEQEVMPALESRGGWMGDCECLHRDGSTFQSTHSISQVDDGGHICVIHHGPIRDR